MQTYFIKDKEYHLHYAGGDIKWRERRKDTWKCHYWRDGFHHKWKISNDFGALHAVCLRLVR